MSRLSKLASLILVITPLMEAYMFPLTSLNLWKAFLILCCLYFYFKGAKIEAPPRYYKTFFIYCIISSFIGALYYSDYHIISSSLIVNVIYYFALVLILPKANLDLCKKYYGIIVALACAFFLLQEAMYSVLGFRVSGLIPFLQVPYDTTTSNFINGQMMSSRSASFFLEPAHFAQYVSGYLAILLGACNRNKKLFSLKPMLLSLVLFITTSGNAILMILVAWVVYVLMFKTQVWKKVMIITVCVAGAFYVFNYVAKTERGEKLLSRTSELESSDFDRVSSGTMRIYRGFFVFSDMPSFLKLTGVGTAGTDWAVENSSNFSWMFGEDRYVNNIQKILIGSGYIGMIIFLMYLLSQFKRTTFEGRLFLALFLVMSFMEYAWLFPKMLLYCGFAWLYERNSKYVEYENKEN